METERDLLMFYQNTLRNVGLFTSLSFTALGYSRFYRGKDKLYNIALIIFSLVTLAIAIMITFFLINDFERYQIVLQSKEADKWLLLPKSIFYFSIGILFLGLYTLYREVRS